MSAPSLRYNVPHGTAAWRKQPKWVVSRSLKSVGPNATLVRDGFEAVICGLKAELDGEIEVGGPDLARSLTDLCLVDEYRLYLHPVVLGHGKPFFAGPRPPLRGNAESSDSAYCSGRNAMGTAAARIMVSTRTLSLTMNIRRYSAHSVRFRG